MANYEDPVIEAAMETLAGERHNRSRAADRVPDQPGLYAFYGDKQAWTELALEPAFDEQPLYVGKAERSLNGRDVRTHFAKGKTGSSTVRRSLAALLGDHLDLVAVPRNVAKPDGSANFALEPASDARLSTWMEQHLETAVVLRLRPPLNLDKVGEPRERLRQVRRHLADQARAWTRTAKPPPA
jgi:hypothetical protein